MSLKRHCIRNRSRCSDINRCRVHSRQDNHSYTLALFRSIALTRSLSARAVNQVRGRSCRPRSPQSGQAQGLLAVWGRFRGLLEYLRVAGTTPLTLRRWSLSNSKVPTIVVRNDAKVKESLAKRANDSKRRSYHSLLQT